VRPRNSAYGEDVQANGQVELLADEDRPGGWLLLLDRVRQSYVDLEDPTYLEFPYVQALAEVIDALPPGPLDVVHVGGGAATPARWVAATRPASVQFIFEPHDELLRTVLARLPLHPASTVTFRRQDGRRGLADRPPARCDVVVVDAFSGGRVPADLTTTEFFADTARVLRTSGILLLNVTDGPPHTYSRRLIAALAEHFCEIVVFGMADTPVGNLVIAAARIGQLPEVAVVDDGPLGGRPLALSGSALDDFVHSVKPLTDSSPMRSPQPPDDTWRIGGEWVE